MSLKRIIAGPILSVLFLFVFFCVITGLQWVFAGSFKNQNKQAFLASIFNITQKDEVKNADETENNFQTIVAPEINAESAITVESNLSGINKIIFAKNIDKKLPIASLTKLMTAIVVLDNYNLSDIIKVSENADLLISLPQDVKPGDELSVENFLEIMLIESSNKSAFTLSELIGEQKFVNLMNQKANDIGLGNTFFADPTGLSPQNISTANDLEKLSEYILRNYPRITQITSQKELDIPGFGKIENTDSLLNEMPGIVCSKTGFTEAAKGCLLLVMKNPKNGNYLINIVLGADDRISEMKKIINYSNAMCE